MKRANGTGCIVKLPGARRRPYAIKFSSIDEHGRVVQRYLDYYATAKDAQAALDDYNAQHKNARVNVHMLDYTVGDIYRLWSARAYERLNPSSISSYTASWNRSVSAIADAKLRKVTIDDLQGLIDEAQEAGKSKSTVNNIVCLLKALYRYAGERDIISKDITQYIDIPVIAPKFEKGAFSREQIEQVFRMSDSGVKQADTVAILCYTGLRLTEFLTLSPDAYNADEQYIRCGIKTAAGKNRVIPIHPRIQPFLLAYFERKSDAGNYMLTTTYRSQFVKIAAEIGAPNATPHWCRHTFSTMLHEAGVDELTCKWLLGHSTSSDVTATYTHAKIEVLRAAVLRLP